MGQFAPGEPAALERVAWKRWNNFLLLAAAAHFALFYALNTRPMLSLVAFEQGNERSPFQYRALTAWVYRFADRAVTLPPRFVSHLPPSMDRVQDFVTVLLTFLSLVVAALATRQALEHLTRDATWSRWGSLLVIAMAYFHYLLEFGHPCCTPLQLPYDLPSLAFFAVAVALIIADRPVWLALVFAVATLNRESTIFLVGLLWMWRSAKGTQPARLYGEMAVLVAVWIMLRVWLHHLFHPAPEISHAIGGFEIHVLDNVGYLLRPYYWTSFLSMFGFTWIFCYAHWREIPDAGVRRMLWIGPVYLAAMYVVGVLSEIRIFGELIPVYVLAFTLLLRRYVGSGSAAGPKLASGL